MNEENQINTGGAIASTDEELQNENDLQNVENDTNENVNGVEEEKEESNSSEKSVDSDDDDDDYEKFRIEMMRKQIQSEQDRKRYETELYLKKLKDDLNTAVDYEEKFRLLEKIHQIELSLKDQQNNISNSRLDLYQKIRNEWDDTLVKGKTGEFMRNVLLECETDEQAHQIVTFVDKLMDLMIEDYNISNNETKSNANVKTTNNKPVDLDKGPKGSIKKNSNIDLTRLHELDDNEDKKQVKQKFAEMLGKLYSQS